MDVEFARLILYLGSIVSALSVESRELSRWIEVVSMDDETGKTMILDVDAVVLMRYSTRLRGCAVGP